MSENRFPSRQIAARILIEAELELTSPAHFGGGSNEYASDMALTLDELDGSPVVWGTSLAGALRNYLNERQFGYPDGSDAYAAQVNSKVSLANILLGFQKDDLGNQSWLLISDAFVKNKEPYDIDFRDLVEIDPATRTPVEKHKFDADLVSAGTIFKVKFELLLPNKKEKEEDTLSLKKAACIALEGLEKGEIHLGAKKSRGWGECIVRNWDVRIYEFEDVRRLVAWLEDDHAGSQTTTSISQALQVETSDVDARKYCRLTATLKLVSPIMIGAVPENEMKPDTEHLSRKHIGQPPVWVLSGTSMAGALRHRSRKILKTIQKEALVDEKNLWGFVEGQDALASRVKINERVLTNVFERIQMRIKINPFTGGTVPGALFNQGVVLPEGDQNTTLEVKINQPHNAEIGLLLLCMKDICSADLSIGGGWGIGRGFMKSTNVTFEYKAKGQDIQFTQNMDDILSITPEASETLQAYVNALYGKAG